MATREINLQFVVGGERGRERVQKCILRVTCRHRILARHAEDGASAQNGKEETAARAAPRTSHASKGRGEGRKESGKREREKGKKKRPRNYSALFAPRMSGCERRTARERNLSIFPVHGGRTAPVANDIDFIRRCGKYICRAARVAQPGTEKESRGIRSRIVERNRAREGIRERRESLVRADQVACAR